MRSTSQLHTGQTDSRRKISRTLPEGKVVISKRKPKPIGFVSYAHFDDSNDTGWISTFVRVFSNEIQAQTGKPFLIFQDRTNIRWGNNWRERIDSALSTAAFFFPILTPSFFGSKECRNELQQFLDHERRLKRGDVIFPVYYIKHRPVEAPNSGGLFRALRRHQRWDFTDLRFEALADLKVRKVIADMAIQIRDAIEQYSSSS